MNWNAPTILAAIALGLAVVGLIKPQWQTTAVAVILLAVAVMIPR